MLITLPAKSLLFGEYGVLLGYTAVAVTSSNYCFTARFENVNCNNEDNFIACIHSRFVVSTNILHIKLDELIELNEIISDKDIKDCLHLDILLAKIPQEITYKVRSHAGGIFIAILSGFLDYIIDDDSILNVYIEECFNPAFGFGSSSAIISSFALYFKNRFLIDEQNLWYRIRKIITLYQRIGSAYDIAVQMKCVVFGDKKLNVKTSNRIFRYQNDKVTPTIEEVTVSDKIKLGYILKSGVYSNTKYNLSSIHYSDKQFLDFAYISSQLADEFIKNISLSNAIYLVNQSLDAQRSFGIAIEILNMAWLKNYKFLGSGHGDSIWCLDEPLGEKEKQRLAQHLLYELKV